MADTNFNRLVFTEQELENKRQRLAKARHDLHKLQVASKLALDTINTYTEQEMIAFLEALYNV